MTITAIVAAKNADINQAVSHYLYEEMKGEDKAVMLIVAPQTAQDLRQLTHQIDQDQLAHTVYIHTHVTSEKLDTPKRVLQTHVNRFTQEPQLAVIDLRLTTWYDIPVLCDESFHYLRNLGYDVAIVLPDELGLFQGVEQKTLKIEDLDGFDEAVYFSASPQVEFLRYDLANWNSSTKLEPEIVEKRTNIIFGVIGKVHSGKTGRVIRSVKNALKAHPGKHAHIVLFNERTSSIRKHFTEDELRRMDITESADYERTTPESSIGSHPPEADVEGILANYCVVAFIGADQPWLYDPSTRSQGIQYLRKLNASVYIEAHLPKEVYGGDGNPVIHVLAEGKDRATRHYGFDQVIITIDRDSDLDLF